MCVLLAATLMFGLTATPAIQFSEGDGFVEVREGGIPILCYSHEDTTLPEGVGEEYNRGDYVSALYGLEGQLLTEDYPADHLHHRAVNWSWATIKWKGEERDLFAVRGIWARPVGKPRVEHESESLIITAESIWKWADKIAVVAESASIRVNPRTDEGRTIDFEIILNALVDNLEFCGRLEAGYSGFNIRMAPAAKQEIAFHTDAEDAQPGRAWADYSAMFAKDKRSGLAILQNTSNPLYPHEWRKYPHLNFFQPLYPGGKLIPMPKDTPTTLCYRLWIHDGGADETALSEQCDLYNQIIRKKTQ